MSKSVATPAAATPVAATDATAAPDWPRSTGMPLMPPARPRGPTAMRRLAGRDRVEADAARRVARLDLDRRRRRGAAGRDGPAAAVGERAAGRQVDQLGHAARNRRQAGAARRAEARPRAEQAARVRMGEVLEDAPRSARPRRRCRRTSRAGGRRVRAITPRSWLTSSSAMPRAATSSPIRSRISPWIVTSSAVVGSSAISRSGPQASAIAMTTRWRWPPDSWCG